MCGLGFRYAEACKNVSKCFVCTNLFNPATLSSNDATQEAPPYETNQSPLALMELRNVQNPPFPPSTYPRLFQPGCSY